MPGFIGALLAGMTVGLISDNPSEFFVGISGVVAYIFLNDLEEKQ